MAKVIPVKCVKDYFISNIVKTDSGKTVLIPRTLGVSTKIDILPDGRYKISNSGNKFLGLFPKEKILSEKELISKYGEYAGKNLQKLV